MHIYYKVSLDFLPYSYITLQTSCQILIDNKHLQILKSLIIGVINPTLAI